MAVWRSRAPRHLQGLLIILILILYTIAILTLKQDTSREKKLEQKVKELQIKLQYQQNRERNEDELVLTRLLGQLMNEVLPIESNLSSSLTPEARTLMSQLRALRPNGQDSLQLLHVPSVFQLLPHLLNNSSSLRPAIRIPASRGRSGVSMVVGLPTIKRAVKNYRLATLQSILDNMTPEEEKDVVIVVLVAETDTEVVNEIIREIKHHFLDKMEDGLIEIIAPTAAYYPDWKILRPALGAAMDMVKWRSKQNLDFAFLMMYSQPKGMFYTQLEDDILVKPHFVTTMKTAALERIANNQPWFVLDFCELGFIGKMFQTKDLPWLINFFFMFYNDKPVDWLVDHLVYTKTCSLDKGAAECQRAKDKLWIRKPSLFQHMGIYSSLKGKIQKLKDKQFGSYTPHINPAAEVSTRIKAYSDYTLKRAYEGHTFFWGMTPQPGDHLLFFFKTPLFIERYKFQSGNAEHPTDILRNTTVEVLPQNNSPSHHISNSTSTADGFIETGRFDSVGLAEGLVPKVLGPIGQMRLTVHDVTDKWVLLSEISIVPGVTVSVS